MKKLLFICFSVFFFHANAQSTDDADAQKGRFGFRVAAGITATTLPSFHHIVLVADRMVIPNYIHPSNSQGPLQSSNVSSTVKMQPGWYARVGVTYRLPKKYALTFSAGASKLRFDYQTSISGSEPANLDELSSDYGKTTLTYLTIQPFNIEKTCMLDYVRVSIGPVINFLLSDKTTNTIAIYNSPESVQMNRPDKVYFDTIGKFRKTMAGVNINADVKIAGPLSLTLTGQYFFGSVFEKEGIYNGTNNPDAGSAKPLVLQGGLTFAIK